MPKYNHYTESLFYKIEQTAKYCRCLAIQGFKKLNIDISMDEFSALDVLMTHNVSCQRDLARLILKDRPNTGRILNSLEKKGFVIRAIDKKNNRNIRKMELTPKGLEFTKQTSEILKKHVENVKRLITEAEEQDLIKILEKLKNSLDKEVEMNI